MSGAFMAKYLLLWGGTGYEFTAVPRIHVVGDFWSTAPQPKAGHMGNQQGKLGTDAIVRLLSDQPLDPAPATDTVEFSPIIADTAAWFTTVFHVAVGANGVAAMVGRPAGESASPTDENFERLFKWFAELHADTLA